MTKVLVEMDSELRDFLLLTNAGSKVSRLNEFCVALRAAKPVIDDPQGLTDAYMLGHYDGKKAAKTAGEVPRVEDESEEVVLNDAQMRMFVQAMEAADIDTLGLRLVRDKVVPPVPPDPDLWSHLVAL